MLICNCKCNSYGKPPTNGVGSANGSRSLSDKPLCLYSVDWVMDAFSIDKRTLIQVLRLLLAHFIREALICRHGFINSLGIFMM